LDYQTFLLDSTHCYSIRKQAGYIGSIIALAIGHAEPIAEGQEVERDGYRLKVEGGRIFRTLTSDQQRQFERGISMTLWSPGLKAIGYFAICEKELAVRVMVLQQLRVVGTRLSMKDQNGTGARSRST